MWTYRRLSRTLLSFFLAWLVALTAILKLPEAALSFVGVKVSETRRQTQAELVAVNSYQEIADVYKRHFVCVQLSGLYRFSQGELAQEIKKLAEQLRPCVQQNRLQDVDVSKLIGVIVTTASVNNASVIVVGAGLRPGNFPVLPVDSDRDGLNDDEEKRIGTDPQNPDTDGDGLRDGDEILLGTNPLKADTDGGGVKDGQEVAGGTDPKNPNDDRTLLEGKDCSANPTKNPDKLFDLGIVNLNVLEDYRCAMDSFQNALTLYSQEGNKAGIALTRNNIGTVDMLQKTPQLEQARANFQQALDIYREIGDKAGISLALFNLGAIHEYQDNISKARVFYTEAIAAGSKERVANYCRNKIASEIIKITLPEITCEGPLRPKGRATTIASGR